MTSAIRWAAVVGGLCAAVATADSGRPHRHPVEEALAPVLGSVTARLVVRNGDGGYDVWLRGTAPLAKVGERLQGAAAVKLELPSGWRVARAEWMAEEQAWWVQLAGPGEVDARVTRDVAGTQVELRDCGVAAAAEPWAPAFAPMPVVAPHGALD